MLNFEAAGTIGRMATTQGRPTGTAHAPVATVAPYLLPLLRMNRLERLAQPHALRLLRWVEQLNRRHCPAGDPAFHDNDRFPWIAALQASAPDIRAELMRLLDDLHTLPNLQQAIPYQDSLTRDDGWKAYAIRAYGMDSARARRECPRTCEALARIPALHNAIFSIFRPGKSVPRHRGFYNGVLRVHLGLLVPERALMCGLEVDEELRHWQEGEAFVFDDCHPHRAWNHSRGIRVVLLLDVLRPLPWRVQWLNRLTLAVLKRLHFGREVRQRLTDWESRIAA